ncbi:MAG: thioredoxin-like domain-containing protein [Bacteroidia bacterium]|nr:thioredoxin-like domain-containing protein [Bacteroidia bacterium]MDW8015640.1 thioredoxin-like domain-containing protein [Bacteroidia bacterium]
MRYAPEFPSGSQWLNVSRPLRLRPELQGRFVLLDFWTYCCINCIHVLPDLKRLEREFPNLVVIGVHAAKFENEKDVENVRAAIVRYDIEHPVVIDQGYRLWSLYRVQAWPTFILIGPSGEVLWSSAGEGIYERLAPLLRQWMEKALPGTQQLRPLPLSLEKYRQPPGLLAFPGKLTLAHRPREPLPFLYFTDSNHNRVIGISLQGEVKEIIGSGHEGWRDGSFEEAEFFRPQGLVYDPSADVLYIADTENHLIRRVWLSEKRVETIAGTGYQAPRLMNEGPASRVSLNSPWDVTLHGCLLYVAMAGSHQLWQIDLQTLYARPLAGSGYEHLIDGPRLAAALAQPSGLTLSSDGRLFFADSESSSIRYVDGEKVHTLVGKGLFEFGYKDGRVSEALFQHPLGLCFHEESLYVADTYNHVIRRIDLKRAMVETVAGTGRRGSRDGAAYEAEFNEPNDIIYAGGFFYITDTNNHLLRRYDPQQKRVDTIELIPVERLVMSPRRTFSIYGMVRALHSLAIPFNRPWRLRVRLPESCDFAYGAPQWLRLGEFSYELGLPLPPLSTPLPAVLTLYLCKKGEPLRRCFPAFYEFQLEPQTGISEEVELSLVEESF